MRKLPLERNWLQFSSTNLDVAKTNLIKTFEFRCKLLKSHQYRYFKFFNCPVSHYTDIMSSNVIQIKLANIKFREFLKSTFFVQFGFTKFSKNKSMTNVGTAPFIFLSQYLQNCSENFVFLVTEQNSGVIMTSLSEINADIYSEHPCI